MSSVGSSALGNWENSLWAEDKVFILDLKMTQRNTEKKRNYAMWEFLSVAEIGNACGQLSRQSLTNVFVKERELEVD